jgi:hypothetical protein
MNTADFPIPSDTHTATSTEGRAQGLSEMPFETLRLCDWKKMKLKCNVKTSKQFHSFRTENWGGGGASGQGVEDNQVWAP